MEDPGSITGPGKSLGEGNGNPLQYSCLENSMARGAWSVIVHKVAKSQTQLSRFHMLEETAQIHKPEMGESSLTMLSKSEERS